VQIVRKQTNKKVTNFGVVYKDALPDLCNFPLS
jgi:hypothetical protein